MNRFIAFVSLTLFFGSCPLAAQEKQIVGWIEKVKILPADLVIHAKLDTGADNSSIHVSNFTEYEKEGRKWVKFDVTNRYGKMASFDKEVVRTAVVKTHSKFEKRQVVRLGLCVGHTYLEADVNLVDRKNFDYQMLIGRSFMAGNLILDPAISYTVEPQCKRGKTENIGK